MLLPADFSPEASDCCRGDSGRARWGRCNYNGGGVRGAEYRLPFLEARRGQVGNPA